MFKIDSEFMKEKNRSISKVILKFPNLFKNILQNNILLTKLKENFVIKNKKDIVKINEDKDEIVNSKKEETQIEMKDIKVKEKSIAINQEEDVDSSDIFEEPELSVPQFSMAKLCTKDIENDNPILENEKSSKQMIKKEETELSSKEELKKEEIIIQTNNNETLKEEIKIKENQIDEEQIIIKIKYEWMTKFYSITKFFFKIEYKLLAIFIPQKLCILKSDIWSLLIFKLLIQLFLGAIMSPESIKEGGSEEVSSSVINFLIRVILFQIEISLVQY